MPLPASLASLAALTAGLRNLRSLAILATSPKGIIEIADIPASIACCFALSPSLRAIAAADLRAEMTELAASAAGPTVGSKTISSRATCSLSNQPYLTRRVSNIC